MRKIRSGLIAALVLPIACTGGSKDSSGPTATLPPTISSFAATPSSITSGESTTLAWLVAGATSVSIDNGIGSVNGTSKSVSPASSTTFTLTASNAGGSVTATAGVTVAAAAVITSFTATPSRITSDQGTTLTWAVNGATAVSIDQGIGTVTGTNRAVMPATTTTYTLSARNSLGTQATATATVTVTGGVGGITLTWNPGSSVKLEQVIGDKDWEQWAKGITLPTESQTSTRYNIYANGFGYSWEENGKMLFIFGDTRAEDEVALNFHAGDPIGYSTTTDGEAPLHLDFFTQANGSPLFTSPPGVKMGADDIANSGITLPDGVYEIVNTGSDVTQMNPHLNSYSVLSRFDEATKTFTAGRTISQLPGGHFVFCALHASGSDVYLYGMGDYRASDVYLQKVPAASFWTGIGTQYFTGMVNGQPTWGPNEASAVPVIQDNPLNGPAWPNDNPTVGNLAVGWSSDLGLWITTFDGGRQAPSTRGIYFSYAKNPWGPWTTPQQIFNQNRDGAYGVYIHNPSAVPDDGLDGPTIGMNDPVTTVGAAFAPQLIERFTKASGNTLHIYWLVSTWNPYTVVKMRSDFTIGRP